MKYDVDYFITKFTAIPEHMWCTGVLHDELTGAHCALGHVGVILAETWSEEMDNDPYYNHGWIVTDEAFALSSLVGEGPTNWSSIYSINDRGSDLGGTPKSRMLSELKRIKARG